MKPSVTLQQTAVTLMHGAFAALVMKVKETSPQ